MPDREKILKQLAGIGIALDMDGHHADAQCVRDALALLREQEPVEPFARYDALRREFDCGVCGFLVGFENAFDDRRYRAKYCPECGKKVKWDEAD